MHSVSSSYRSLPAPILLTGTGKKRKRECDMDGTPQLLQRLLSTIFYLVVGVFLAESSRALLAWIQSLSRPRDGRATLTKNNGQASVAVLIDGENISSPQVERVVALALDEAKMLG